MELYTLNINVNKQRLSFGENKPEIFSGDQSIDFVEFTFEDDMWNFPDIWAIFSRFKGTSYQVALEDNKVMIPAEVMQKKGYVYIGLMATDGENVQTSSVLQYSIGQGSTNVDAITPSASIYEQFLADLDAYQTAVADLEDIESRITTAEGNVSMIEQTVTDLNEQLDDINVDISTINGQITTIQNNIGTAQGDIVSIQNGINTLNGQVAGLDTAVGTLSNRVTALQSSVTSLEGRLTTIGNTLTDFEGRLTTAGTTLTNLEGGISDAENDIQTVQGDIETIQSDIEDIQTAIEQNNVVTDVTAEGISLVDNHIADLSFMCVTDTASGDVASFPDGSGVAMKKAEVSLEPIQDLHGYDKPWPAGGGSNKWDEEWEYGRYSTSTGEADPSGGVRSKNFIPVFPSTTYFLSCDAISTNDFRVLFYDADKNFIDANGWAYGDTTFVTRSNAHFVKFFVTSTNYGNTYNNDIAINYPSTVTTYSPYSNICPIDGYEDVGVSVVGKNLVDISRFADEYPQFCTYSDDVLSVNTTGAGTLYSQGISVDIPAGSVARGIITQGTATNVRVRFIFADNSIFDVTTFGQNGYVAAKAIKAIRFNWTAQGTFTLSNFQIELGSTATAYEPYAETDYTTNLVTNVWDEEWETGGYNVNTGEKQTDNARMRCKNLIPVMPNTDYSFNFPYVVRTTGFYLFRYDAEQIYLGWELAYDSVITMPSDTHYIAFVTNPPYTTTYTDKISICTPPIANDTVYNGVVDLATGRFTISSVFIKPNKYFASASGYVYVNNGWALTLQNYPASVLKGEGNVISSVNIPLQYNLTTGSGFCKVLGGGRPILWLKDTDTGLNSSSTVAERDEAVLAFITEYEPEAVYELATPQTYQLTPQQIQTLIGANNVWSEDGAIEVEYIANLKDYIDKKINA